jgi:tetratricopeptide (TPR) repeat protein
MNLEKLKDTARKHEQREEWRKAIEVYQRVLQAYESGEEAAPDLALYNKVGDLQRRVGDISAAVRSYERAVELYAEQGFSNNAIAVCGKILRDDPHRSKTYLQLARLHAKKNMAGEAKKHLIEYLERMNHGGLRDEAFKELKDFTDQFAGSEEIRVMLAELLRVASRTAEAQEQLEKLANQLESKGDQAGAQRTRERMHEMDAGPAAPVEEPRRKNDLIFLDTGIDLPFARPPASGGTPQAEFASVEVPPEPPEPMDFPVGEITVSASDLMDVPLEIDPSEFDVAPMEGLDRVTADDLGDLTLLPVDPDLVADQTRLDPSEAPPALEGFEPTLGDEAGTVPLVASDRTGLVSDLTIDLTSSSIDEAHPERVEQEPLLGDLDLTVELAPMVDSYASAEQPVWGEDDLAPEGQAASAPPVAEGDEPSAEDRLSALEDRVLDDPDNPEIHRALGEALLATGQHERGLEELDLALARYEELEDWDNAEGVAEELTRLEPSGIRYFQKMVELAYRGGQRARVIDTYLALGDALVRVGAVDKALAVYGRVAEQEPDNQHALAAIDALAPPAPASPATPPPAKAAPASTPDDFVDLGALIQEDDRVGKPKDTRMRVQDEEPTGDEEKDFAEMLKQFKRGLDENLDDEDFQSHYDLGVAFKEMGLLDEAISEFQKALRSPAGRMRTSEALGSSFFDKGQFAVAEAILRRAVDGLGGQDDEKIGLLYWLGRALEAEGRAQEAQPYYRRALAVDIHFMDLAERLRAITNGGAP